MIDLNNSHAVTEVLVDIESANIRTLNRGDLYEALYEAMEGHVCPKCRAKGIQFFDLHILETADTLVHASCEVFMAPPTHYEIKLSITCRKCKFAVEHRITSILDWSRIETHP